MEHRLTPFRASPTAAGWSLQAIPLAVYVGVVVFALRLVVLVRLTESPFLLPAQGDMHFYNEWALRITRGEWTDGRAFYGLPLYAYLLAALYTVFGYSPFIPGLIQAALEGGTAALLVQLGGRTFGAAAARGLEAGPVTRLRMDQGTTVGLIAAAGWAAFLPAQSYSVILMPTAWLVFVFWWIVWWTLKSSAPPPAGMLLLLGLVIGVTAMGIATILFLVPFVLAALVFRWNSERRPNSRWRSTLLAALLLLLGVAAGTSPAWIHNYFVARDAVFLSAHSGVNLWIGNNPHANGYPRFPLGLRAGQQAMLKDSITGAEAAAGRPLKRSEVSEYWAAKAKHYIAKNPGAWLKLLGRKIANFWNSFQYDDLSIITSLREQGITFPGIRFGIVAALALAGIPFAMAAWPLSRWVLGAILLHLASLLSVFVTERYRLAAVPGLLLFAAFTVSMLWQAVALSRYSRAIACTLLLIVSAFAVSARRGDAELWALDNYNSGLQAFESGRLKDAERKLQLAYAYVPDNAELNFALGNLHFAYRDTAKAKLFYAQTLRLDPRHEGTFNNLGVIALEEQRWDIAADLFAKALEQEPNDPKTRYLLARALLGAGEREKAAAEIETALQLNPTQPEFLQLRDEIHGHAPPRPE